jgi:cytochrome c biogenesis protein CcdA
MKKLYITGSIIGVFIIGVVMLKYLPGTAGLIWNVSQSGTWLLPLILFSAILDSVHPCSFSILLITIAFLFGMQADRFKILKVGAVYISGIFLSYLLIGLGILQTFHLFDTPHFMGKLGAGILIAFGVINILGEMFPQFPIRLKLPSVAHNAMGNLIGKASIFAAFALGLLVGICQFPCMGGPYLMVIGLLKDNMTYWSGASYLILYNLILIVPLAAMLIVAADKSLLEKVKEWKSREMSHSKIWIGLAMIIIGILIFFI